MFTPLAHALRSLNRSRVFAAVAVGTLGAALGIAIAVFALVNGVIHPPEVVRDADRLFTVWSRGDGSDHRVTGAQRIDAVRTSVAAIDALALRVPELLPVETGSWSQDATVDRVSADFFTLLGATPTQGRFFTVATAESGRAAVVVSYSFWRSALGARSIRGESVRVGDRRYDVIGVAPFQIETSLPAKLWLVEPHASDIRATSAVVHLKPGATLGALQGQLVGAARRLTANYGVGRVPFRFEVRSLRPDPLELQESHRALGVAALAIFLIACANLTSLLLARGQSRSTEAAVRRALGARRRDIVRDALTECLVVSLAGAALGLAMAHAIHGVVQRALPPTVPYFGTVVATFDWRVWVFAVVAAVAAAVLIGLVPALRASEADLSTPLKERSSGTVARTQGRYSALVIVEVTLALAIVSAGGLLVRASYRLRHEDPGFARDELVEGWVSPRRWRDTSAHVSAGFFDEVAARAAALPGVTSSAWKSMEATDGGMVTAAVRGEGSREIYLPSISVVSSGYLKTMGLTMAMGRDFEPGDASAGGGVVLSARAARELWRGASPIGDRLALAPLRRSREWLPVVGVTRATHEFGQALDYYASGYPEVYVMRLPSREGRTIVVRTTAEQVPRATLELSQLLRAAVPGGMTRFVLPLRQVHDEIAGAHRFLSSVFIGLGAFALLLAVVGLSSVLSYAASRRTREFAVRMAMGASARDVARHVAHDGAVMILAGTAVGAFLAMWASQLVDPFLFDLYRIDAATLVAAEGVVGVVTGAACALVAWRAARIDPVQMLRSA